MALLKLLRGNINAIAYQHQILNNVQTLKTMLVGFWKPWIFMHDLAPAHNARDTLQFFVQNGVRVLE